MRRSFWAWGWEERLPDQAAREALGAHVATTLGSPAAEPRPLPPLDQATAGVPAPRVAPPSEIADIGDASPEPRVRHTYGRASRDLVRGFACDFSSAPDFVCLPRSEEDVARALEACARAGITVAPYGGGTSVVGGVEAGGRGRPACSLDLCRLSRVLEVDPVSRAARIQAGALGPDLEGELRPHGLTLRHFPQSFEFSTLGGWIATRAGGHFATLYTHIDDLVESVRALTPAGVWESRRLPGSGAGISPDRMLIRSEGTLRSISEAWGRVRPRPRLRATAAVSFDDFAAGASAVRVLSQSGLYPANCRLIDPGEAAMTGAGDGEHALLVLGFESADHPVDPWMERALECCGDYGGEWDEPGGDGRAGAVGAWRDAFLRAPYLRDIFVAMGVFTETFETAIT